MSIITDSIYFHGVFSVYIFSTFQDSRQIKGLVANRFEAYSQEYSINEKAVSGKIIRHFNGWRYKFKYIFNELDIEAIDIINWLYNWMQADNVSIMFQPDLNDNARNYEVFNSNDYDYNFIANKNYLNKKGVLELTSINLLASLGYFFDGETNTIHYNGNEIKNADIEFLIAKGSANRLFLIGVLYGSLAIYINNILKKQINRNGYFQIFVDTPTNNYYQVSIKATGTLKEYLIFQDRG